MTQERFDKTVKNLIARQRGNARWPLPISLESQGSETAASKLLDSPSYDEVNAALKRLHDAGEIVFVKYTWVLTKEDAECMVSGDDEIVDADKLGIDAWMKTDELVEVIDKIFKEAAKCAKKRKKSSAASSSTRSSSSSSSEG